MRTHPVVWTVVALGLVGWARGQNGPGEPRWWKGNTHTHTYWSDGNAAPEHVVDWYVEHGYQFLVLSDHNILSRGEKWFPVSTEGRRPLTPQDVEDLERRFGPGWVEVRTRDGRTEMRLKTLEELRARFERPGGFVLIEGEEITNRFERQEVHINAMNIDEVIEPVEAASVREMIQRTIDAVIEHGRSRGVPVLAHLNHPNYRHSLTAEDLAAIRGERFFEVYNGHRGSLSHGDETTLSTEQMWDIALTLRLTALDLGLMYGLATDDAHHHHGREWTATPGRGWIWVRAPELTAGAIIDAMHRGDFYASTGVRLRGFGVEDGSMWIEIDAEPGVTYTTRFIGVRMRDGAPVRVGEVLGESASHRPTFVIGEDVLYVRAVIESSRPHPNPFAEGDMESAWVQPVVGPAGAKR